MSSEEELRAAIAAKGDEIRAIKAEKPPTMKEDLAPLIAELGALKLSFKEVTGTDFDPPKAEKKPKGPAQPERKKEGPSKTELNKAAKKAAKEAARAKERAEKEAAGTLPAKNDQSVAVSAAPTDEDEALSPTSPVLSEDMTEPVKKEEKEDDSSSYDSSDEEEKKKEKGEGLRF